MNRAYSLLTIKAVDDEARELTGIATTPTADRLGDVVASEGADFKLPIPFLWQHDATQPIGQVTKAKVGKAGIEVTVKLAKTDEPGTLKERLDEAWQSIKLGLVRGLSIGFKPIEYSFIEESGGVRFLEWLWLELSAVTIPANAEATIQTVKSIDTAERAALGQDARGVVRLDSTSPGASGTSGKSPKRKETKVKQTIQEQIAGFEAKRAANLATMNALTEKAAETGSVLDEAQSEEFDGLQAENDSIDKHLPRLRVLEKAALEKAAPVNGTGTRAASESRGGVHTLQLKEKLAPGIAFARYARCVGLAAKNHRDPATVAKQLYPGSVIESLLLKTDVPAGATIAGNWAANLVGEETAVFADFVEFLRPMTILGKFGTGGVPSLRRVPFRAPLIGQTDGGEGYWVGEGKAKPLTKFGFERKTLEPLKVANIAVLTEEILRDSSPSAEMIIRDSLAAALRSRLDRDFINPDKDAVAGVSPASITNGVTPSDSSGNTEDAVRVDLKTLWGTYIAADLAPTSAVWIMPSTVALSLSLMTNALGQPSFPGITMNGGTFMGVPVITSEYVPPSSDGALVILVNAQDIYLADDGDIRIDLSREASLEMADNPAHNSTTPTDAQLVSMFQTNSVAFRAERTINWMRRREAGVAFLANVNWGSA